MSIAAAAAALLFLSCGRGPERGTIPAGVPEGIAIPASGPLVLVAMEDGTFQPLGAQARSPTPFPLARAPLAIQAFGDKAIFAVNRLGLRELGVLRVAVEAASTDSGLRLAIRGLPGVESEFPGRTVSTSWSADGDAYFLLFRHPVFETEPPRSPPSIVVRADFEGAGVLERGLGADAYAVYPVSADAWLVQSRRENADRVDTEYASFDPRAGTAKNLSRAAFEKLASPLPLSAASPRLQSAAQTLDGPLLVEARLPDGSRRAYVRGDPGDAAPAWAQDAAPDDGAAVALIVTDDWRIAASRSAPGAGTAYHLRLDPPLPDARVRDAAFVGGVIVIVWEEDLFPDVGLSGLAVIKPSL